MFITNRTYAEFIFINPISTHIWIMGSHLGIFTPYFGNFGSKNMLDNPKHDS